MEVLGKVSQPPNEGQLANATRLELGTPYMDDNLQVAVKGMAPFFGGGDDVVVDVTVDEQGRMIDYAVVAGATALANASLRRRLENVLLFTEFTPATSFGQPMSSKTRLWFRTSRIDVKG